MRMGCPTSSRHTPVSRVVGLLLASVFLFICAASANAASSVASIDELLDAARAAVSHRDYARALALADSAIRASERQGEFYRESVGYEVKVASLLVAGRHREVDFVEQDVARRLEQAVARGYTSGAVRASLCLAHIAMARVAAGEMQTVDAERLLSEAVARAGGEEYAPVRAGAYYDLASLASMSGDRLMALHYCGESAREAQTSDDDHIASKAKTLCDAVASFTAPKPLARDGRCLLREPTLSESDQDSAARALSLFFSCRDSEKVGKKQIAVEYGMEALRLLRKLGLNDDAVLVADFIWPVLHGIGDTTRLLSTISFIEQQLDSVCEVGYFHRAVYGFSLYYRAVAQPCDYVRADSILRKGYDRADPCSELALLYLGERAGVSLMTRDPERRRVLLEEARRVANRIGSEQLGDIYLKLSTPWLYPGHLTEKGRAYAESALVWYSARHDTNGVRRAREELAGADRSGSPEGTDEALGRLPRPTTRGGSGQAAVEWTRAGPPATAEPLEIGGHSRDTTGASTVGQEVSPHDARAEIDSTLRTIDDNLRGGSHELAALQYQRVANLYNGLRDYRNAVLFGQKALAIYEQIAARVGDSAAAENKAGVLSDLVTFYLNLGEVEKASELAAQATAHPATGDFYDSNARIIQALTLLRSGRYDAGASMAEQVIKSCREPYVRALLAIMLYEVAWARSDSASMTLWRQTIVANGIPDSIVKLDPPLMLCMKAMQSYFRSDFAACAKQLDAARTVVHQRQPVDWDALATVYKFCSLCYVYAGDWRRALVASDSAFYYFDRNYASLRDIAAVRGYTAAASVQLPLLSLIVARAYEKNRDPSIIQRFVDVTEKVSARSFLAAMANKTDETTCGTTVEASILSARMAAITSELTGDLQDDTRQALLKERDGVYSELTALDRRFAGEDTGAYTTAAVIPVDVITRSTK